MCRRLNLWICRAKSIPKWSADVISGSAVFVNWSNRPDSPTSTALHSDTYITLVAKDHSVSTAQPAFVGERKDKIAVIMITTDSEATSNNEEIETTGFADC